MTRRNALRWAGLAGVAGSLGYVIGDVLLFGRKGQPERHPRVSEALGTNRSVLWMLPSSTGRLTVGAMLGVLASPLQLAGIWHLHRGLAPAGPDRALPPTLLLGAAWTLGPFIHGSYLSIGQTYKSLDELEAPDADAREALLRQGAALRRATVVAYVPFLLSVLASSVQIGRLIGSGATAYPRWSAYVVAPALPVVATTAATASHVLPGTAGHLFQGAGISLGHAVSFAVSTALLWRRSVEI